MCRDQSARAGRKPKPPSRAAEERIIAVLLVRVRSKEDDKICFRFAILEHRFVAAAATDVIKIQPLFYVFSHVCEWKRKSEKRGRKRRRTSARTRRYVRRWTFETDRRKKRIIFSCFFVFLSFFLYSFLFGLRDIIAFLSALFLCSR